eukprot:scaffold19374_cov69-Phaeocystis_antarctica.AAC.2
MRLAGLQRCQPTRLVAQDVWPYEGRAGGHKGALPRAPGLTKPGFEAQDRPIMSPSRRPNGASREPTRIVGLGY